MNYSVQSTSPTAAYQPQTALRAPVSLPMANSTQMVTAPVDSFNMSVPAAYQQPAVSFQPQAYSPYVPTLTNLNISKQDLQWATEFEAKIQQGYQPTAEEVSYYQNLGAQLSVMRNNIQPLSPAQPMPQIQNWGAPPPVNQPQQPNQPAADPFADPKLPRPDQQVTMSEIEWALIMEEKVQKYGYKPTPEEEVKYQNILQRFKTNQEIKMTFLDSLAAQSPWVGANVAAIRYSKIMGSEVSKVISGFKNGAGSVLSGLKGLGITAAKATGLSALVSGGFSAVTNAIAYYRGERTATQAVANVASDTVTGAAVGLGATLTGSIAATALAATSITGIPLTLLIGGASILGGYLADKFLVKTGVREWVKSKVIGLMMTDEEKARSTPPTQQKQATQPAAQQNTQGGYQQPQQPQGYYAPAYGY